MKSIREGGSVDIQEWDLNVFEDADAAFGGALSKIVRQGVEEAIEAAIAEEAPIVFHDDGTFSLYLPLNSYPISSEPVFKFDLVAQVSEEISFMGECEAENADIREHLNKIRATLLKSVRLIDKALGS